MDPESGISYPEPAPQFLVQLTSRRACRRCKGLGYVNIVDCAKIIPDDSKSIPRGRNHTAREIQNSPRFSGKSRPLPYARAQTSKANTRPSGRSHGRNPRGTDVKLDLRNETLSTSRYDVPYEGLVKYIEMQQSLDAGAEANKWSGQFFSRTVCPECLGNRLNKVSLHYFIDGKA